MKKLKILWLIGLVCLASLILVTAAPGAAAHPGEEALVIYNRNLPQSGRLAEYYAQCRQVPAAQVLGLDLPIGESLTRTEYREQLERPVLKYLEEQQLFQYKTEIRPASQTEPGRVLHRLSRSAIRYAVLCHGVPLRIANDPNLPETGQESMRVELRRNGAAVDNELAVLPYAKNGYPLVGPLVNPMYGTTNMASLHPTNGLLMVSRLDGPTPEIARRLVDQARQAETNGLWGRAYFDARGVTNGTLLLGDEWIRQSAGLVRRLGFETILDNRPETFGEGFPLSQVALYAGWYDSQASGPFTRPKVEFMPGAFAYHIYSFSASTLRSPPAWAAALLEKGATATVGFVDEPYLEMTMDLPVFYHRFLQGATLGEAVYAALRALSWQAAVVGDPLYRPFGESPQALHERLEQRKSPLLEWSHLRIVNLNHVTGASLKEQSDYLQQLPGLKTSAVLLEKLADLQAGQKDLSKSVATLKAAQRANPTPVQQIRLAFTLAKRLEEASRESDAFSVLKDFLRKNEDYPQTALVYEKLVALAKSLGKVSEAEKYQNALNQLK